jgi:hypothetical protein
MFANYCETKKIKTEGSQLQLSKIPAAEKRESFFLSEN